MNLGYRLAADVWPNLRALPSWLQEDVLDTLDAMVESPSDEVRQLASAGGETFVQIVRVNESILHRVKLRLLWDAPAGVADVIGLQVTRRRRFDLD